MPRIAAAPSLHPLSWDETSRPALATAADVPATRARQHPATSAFVVGVFLRFQVAVTGEAKGKRRYNVVYVMRGRLESG